MAVSPARSNAEVEREKLTIDREKLGVEQEKLKIERLKLLVEVWKKTVDVQQHFNDLALRIRNFALTLLVGVLGGTALALRDAPMQINLAGLRMSLASALLLAGFGGWVGFWMLDRHWYHRLLIGAVMHGKRIEKGCSELPLDLTCQIEKTSHLEAKSKRQKVTVIIAMTVLLTGIAAWTVQATWGLRAVLSLGRAGVAVLAAFAIALLLQRLLLPDWKLKARTRIDLFYGFMGMVLLTLAYILRQGVPPKP